MTSSTSWRLTEVLAVPLAWTLAPPSTVPLAAPPSVSYLKDSVSAAVWKTFIGPVGGVIPGLGNTPHGSIK